MPSLLYWPIFEHGLVFFSFTTCRLFRIFFYRKSTMLKVCRSVSVDSAHVKIKKEYREDTHCSSEKSFQIYEMFESFWRIFWLASEIKQRCQKCGTPVQNLFKPPCNAKTNVKQQSPTLTSESMSASGAVREAAARGRCTSARVLMLERGNIHRLVSLQQVGNMTGVFLNAQNIAPARFWTSSFELPLYGRQ